MAVSVEMSGPAHQGVIAHLTTEQLDALRSVLIEAVEEQRAQLEQNDALIAALTANPSDDASGRDRGMARLASERAREALADLEGALARLDDGTYGSCGSCARPVPFERLEAIPDTRLCVACTQPTG